MKILVCFLITTLLVLTSALAAPAEFVDYGKIVGRSSYYTSMKYDLTETLELKDGTKRTSSSTVWLTKNALRIERRANGSRKISIKIPEVAAYILDPLQKIAQRFELLKSEKTRSSLIKFERKVLGKTTLDGKPCTLIEAIDKENELNMTVWWWDKYGLPLKVVTTSKEGVLTSLYKNIVINPPLPKSLFEVPAGTKVIQP